MPRPLHHGAFVLSVAWTLALLLLGSVVHATGSSLACPDWPTCFGSMTPAMVGGVFWEHLHRLVAGGLILLFGVATWLAGREVDPDRRWVVRAAVAGVVLLLVQAVFGGLTVLWRLPDAVSTTHLALAFGFLGLAVVLAAATSPKPRPPIPEEFRAFLRRPVGAALALVFAQSLLGAYLRHSDAGMACGRGLLCNGGLVPPVFDHAVGLNYAHRALGLLTAGAIVYLVAGILRRSDLPELRLQAWLSLVLVGIQVALGFAGAWTILAVIPVSLHTLGAASLLAVLVSLAARGWMSPERAEAPEPAPAGSGRSA